MKFIQGDCYEILGSEESEFDGVVTDPPYSGSTASNCPVDGSLNCPTFSNASFLALADSATKKKSFLVFTTNYPNGAEIHHLSKDSPWDWKATMVWDKRPTRSWVAWSRPLKCVEYIHFYTKGNFKLSFKDGTERQKVKRKNFGGGMKASGGSNKAEVSYGMFQEIFACPPPRERIHPTQKPTELSEMIAMVVGKESSVVDPFCGSGAMLEAFSLSVGIDLKDWRSAL